MRNFANECLNEKVLFQGRLEYDGIECLHLTFDGHQLVIANDPRFPHQKFFEITIGDRDYYFENVMRFNEFINSDKYREVQGFRQLEPGKWWKQINE
jgi:hypothetical protein